MIIKPAGERRQAQPVAEEGQGRAAGNGPERGGSGASPGGSCPAACREGEAAAAPGGPQGLSRVPAENSGKDRARERAEG